MMARPVRIVEPPALGRLHPLASLGRLPQFRDLFVTLSGHRIKVRYKQSRLGLAWAVLQPVTMMLVFTLMFSFLGSAPGEGVPYPLFAYAALMPWTMFSSGVSAAAGALTGHAALLTKVYFPREILPLTYVAAALVDFAVAALALGGLMIYYGVGLSATGWWALPAMGLLVGFLSGAGLLLSAFQIKVRDVGIAMPVLLQVWLFATPVLYPLSLVRASLPDWLYWLYIANPMAGIIDTFRRSVVLHQSPDPYALAASAVVTSLLLPAAYVYFKYAELTMADVI